MRDISNFGAYLSRNRSYANDLAQETLYKGLRFRELFDGKDLRSWLFKIMRRTHLNNEVVRKREPCAQIGDNAKPMFYDAPAFDYRTLEDRFDIERALERLPEHFRRVLLLYEVNGVPLEEIARVMGCEVGTVKSRLFRAKEQMRNYLVEMGWEPKKMETCHIRPSEYAENPAMYVMKNAKKFTGIGFTKFHDLYRGLYKALVKADQYPLVKPIIAKSTQTSY